MFDFLKSLFGGGGKKRKEYNFRKLERVMGPWEPYTGSSVIKKGIAVPKNIELPNAVKKWGDEPGLAPISTALFPYWLRIDPTLAGFVASKAAKGKMYTKTKIPREGKTPREICSPDPLLKFMQRRILRRILDKVEVNEAAHGFVKDRSIFTAAEPHAGKRVVLTIDIRDFFGTISFRRVKGMFKAMGFKKEKAALLAGLCCYEGKLPQGAPTSPMISNIICRRLDARLSGLCRKKGFSYTRYADDMIFSGGEKLAGLVPFIKQILESEGFTVADEKTHIWRSGSRQKALGLNLNGEKPTVPRKARRLIRAMVHRQTQEAFPDSDMIQFLHGHVAFMAALHPEQAEALKKQLKGLC